MIDEKKKHSIDGYSRPIQILFPNDSIFHIIPLEVNNLCLVYYDNSLLKRISKDIYSPKISVQYNSIKRFRFMLQHKNNSPIREVIKTGVVPRIIRLSRNHKYEQLQMQALLALATI